MKIGIIGVGVVGKATMQGLSEYHEVCGWDKYNTAYRDLAGILNSEAIFVCVPTPTNQKTGVQDISALEETFQMLYENDYQGAVIIKSTVLPGTTEKLAEEFGFVDQTAHNPEFLTAATPLQDFINQPGILIGGAGSFGRQTAYSIYLKAGFKDIQVYKSARVTELAKYLHNLFLSAKVSFLNEMAEMIDHVGCQYNVVLEAALMMKGIDKKHTRVPGPDGKLGFGGMCFPKDTLAFLTFAKEQGLPMEVLKGTVEGNKRRRPEYY